MILSWLGVIFAVLGILLTVLTAGLLGFYFSFVPTGSNAMGLVIPFFTAIAAGVAMLAAAVFAGSRGGLDWLGYARGTSLGLLLIAAVLVGVAVFGALQAWNGHHPLGQPFILLLTGLALPIVFLAFLITLARIDPASAPDATVRALGVGALVAAIAGAITAGLLIQAQARNYAANQARLADSRRVEQAETDRVEALTPEQKLREELGKFAAEAPLWCVVAGLPGERNPALRAILIERSLQVPDLANDLASTLASDYGIYRHGCLALMAEAPDTALQRDAWAGLLGREAELTAADIRKAGDLGVHHNDPLAQHVAHWTQAAARMGRKETWAQGFDALRAVVAALPPTAERTQALQQLDALGGAKPESGR